ncbi:hypothetical protein [Sphingosinicella rhizophila]|uniref:Uncharacterized protein n=1 Tax=Sphingosinicella rhizophila TaxID=3050082 RepID=A0ABU3Q9H0_9SPHN|nr:hypothetical protein [Sphingosinicella sp. GR2756]MDT9600059.1 hypothetical protein [Sphingosinicella sp. GR2756]
MRYIIIATAVLMAFDAAAFQGAYLVAVMTHVVTLIDQFWSLDWRWVG